MSTEHQLGLLFGVALAASSANFWAAVVRERRRPDCQGYRVAAFSLMGTSLLLVALINAIYGRPVVGTPGVWILLYGASACMAAGLVLLASGYVVDWTKRVWQRVIRSAAGLRRPPQRR
jgi:hypothetical protein